MVPPANLARRAALAAGSAEALEALVARGEEIWRRAAALVASGGLMPDGDKALIIQDAILMRRLLLDALPVRGTCVRHLRLPGGAGCSREGCPRPAMCPGDRLVVEHEPPAVLRLRGKSKTFPRVTGELVVHHKNAAHARWAPQANCFTPELATLFTHWLAWGRAELMDDPAEHDYVLLALGGGPMAASAACLLYYWRQRVLAGTGLEHLTVMDLRNLGLTYYGDFVAGSAAQPAAAPGVAAAAAAMGTSERQARWHYDLHAAQRAAAAAAAANEAWRARIGAMFGRRPAAAPPSSAQAAQPQVFSANPGGEPDGSESDSDSGWVIG